MIGMNGLSRMVRTWLPWFAVLLLGLSVQRLMPPMSAPDEMDHVGRAAQLSSGSWRLAPTEPPAGLPPDEARYYRQSGAWIDVGVARFTHAFKPLLLNPALRITPAQQVEVAALRWAGRNVFQALPGTGYYFPAVYLPQAVGLAIGRAAGWSILDSYQLARGLAWACAMAVLALAWRVARPPLVVTAVLLLPMSLFQAIAPVIDGLTNALAVLAIALTLRASRDPHGHGWAACGALCASVFAVVSSRPQLLPLLALPLVGAAFARSRGQAVLAGVTALACAAWLVLAIGQTVDLRVVRSTGALETARLLLADPSRLVGMIATTLSDANQVLFLGQSFIGILGWLDAPMLRPFYPVLTGVLVVLVLTELVSPQRATWRGSEGQLRVGLAFGAFLAGLLVFVALAIAWTPYPATQIQGLQGRYFTVPALMLGFALGRWPRTDEPVAPGWIATTTLTVLATASGLGLVQTLLLRHH